MLNHGRTPLRVVRPSTTPEATLNNETERISEPEHSIQPLPEELVSAVKEALPPRDWERVLDALTEEYNNRLGASAAAARGWAYDEASAYRAAVVREAASRKAALELEAAKKKNFYLSLFTKTAAMILSIIAAVSTRMLWWKN